MILKKAYVSSFGKLKDFTIEFKDGINCICAENGFGKTTFAVFLKVMLYGFSGGGSSSVEKNERKKYLPWVQSGNYGGYIVYEHNGVLYKCEKVFGRTAKDDRTVVYNLATNKQEVLSGEIGELCFGIDCDGFSKSIYFGEKENDDFKNLSIQAKLSNRIENTSDMSSYDDAIKALDNKRKLLNRSGGGGKINELKVDLSEIAREIEITEKTKELATTYANDLREASARLAVLKEKKKNLEASIAQNQRQYEMLARKEHLKTLESDVANLKIRFEEECVFFAKLLPSESQVYEMENLAREIEELKSEIERLGVDKNDNLFYESNKEKYAKISAQNIDKAIEIALSKGRAKKQKNMWLFAFSVTSFALSILLFVLSQYIFGGVAVCLAVCLLMAFLLTGKNGKVESNFDDIEKLVSGIEINKNDCVAELFTLKNEFEKWKKIDNYINNVKVQCQSYEKALLEKQNNLAYFLSNFPKNENDLVALQIIKSHLNNYKFLENEISQKNSRISGVAGSVIETSIDTDSGIDFRTQLELCEREIDELSTRVLELRKKLQDASNDVASLSEFERVRENLLEQLAVAKTDYDMVVKAIALLQKAKERLDGRYLMPMKDNFNQTLASLDTEFAKSGVFSTDLEISVESGGELKEQAYFSQGYKDLLNFCTRVALVKTLYANEKPFVILDDSFVRLDEKNFASVKQLLKQLSNEYQIIYFVCSKDRMI